MGPMSQEAGRPAAATAPPGSGPQSFRETEAVASPAGHTRVPVNPIRRVAILLVVQGVGEAALGLVYLAFLLSARRAETVALLPAGMAGMVSGLAVLLLAAAALKITAGLRNHAYRSRPLGLVALASGVVSLLTCACAPTGLALLVYGMRVYSRPWPTTVSAVIDTPRPRT